MKKTFKFRVTATVTKIEEVEIDTEGLTEEEAEDMARDQVYEQFNALCDGNEEAYNEEVEIIVE